MLPVFDERKGGDGLRGEQNRDTLLKNAEKFYFALTSGERSAIILGRNKENVRYGRFSVNKRFGDLLLIPDVRPSENFAKRRR